MPDAATVIAALSALVALVSATLAGLAWWQVRDTAASTRRLANIEAARHANEVAARQRAYLSACLEDTRHGTYLTLIRNDGPAVALDIRAAVASATDPTLDFGNYTNGSLETPRLIRGAEYGFLISAGGPYDPPYIVTVTWHDETGEHTEAFQLR